MSETNKKTKKYVMGQVVQAMVESSSCHMGVYQPQSNCKYLATADNLSSSNNRASLKQPTIDLPPWPPLPSILTTYNQLQL